MHCEWEVDYLDARLQRSYWYEVVTKLLLTTRENVLFVIPNELPSK